MGKQEKIDMMVEGGAAKADAAMSQRLGPLKINIQDILKKINEKTAAFKGMKIPVKVIVDLDTKESDIEVGTPPISELIKKELGLEKGSGTPDKVKVGNIAIEQLLKVTQMKRESMFDKSIKSALKTCAGSCNALGLLVEGKESKDFNVDLEAGKFDDVIKANTTEMPDEKKDVLKEQLDKVNAELQAKFAKAAKEKGSGVKKEKEEAGEEEKKEEGKEEKKGDKKEAPKKEEKKK